MNLFSGGGERGPRCKINKCNYHKAKSKWANDSLSVLRLSLVAAPYLDTTSVIAARRQLYSSVPFSCMVYKRTYGPRERTHGA